MAGGSFGPTNFTIPSGTTAERPLSPSTGSFRYNTSLQMYEVYDGNMAKWLPVDPSVAR